MELVSIPNATEVKAFLTDVPQVPTFNSSIDPLQPRDPLDVLSEYMINVSSDDFDGDLTACS